MSGGHCGRRIEVSSVQSSIEATEKALHHVIRAGSKVLERCLCRHAVVALRVGNPMGQKVLTREQLHCASQVGQGEPERPRAEVATLLGHDRGGDDEPAGQAGDEGFQHHPSGPRHVAGASAEQS